jgi:protein-export membrane protein SecD
MLHFAPWKAALIVGTVLLGLLFALPNFFPTNVVANWPGFVPRQQIVLGLDLQGGSHLLLEVDRAGVVQARLDTISSDVRRYLRDARIAYTGIGVQNGTVQVRITDPTQVQAAITALAPLTQATGINVFGGASPSEVSITTEADGLLRLRVSDAATEQRVRGAVSQSIEVIRRRIDELGTVEPNIQAQGADRIVVQVPGLDDPERLKELLQQTAQLTFHMVDQRVSQQALAQTRPTPDQLLLPSAEEPGIYYLVERIPLVSGEDLDNAQATFDSRTNEPAVSFRFNTSGARAFGQATAQNVGRQFAIVLDDAIISAPNIREPIPGGTGQISGGFTVEQANDLAILLRAGALPADLTIIEQRTVGASLGQDSIRAGIIASIVAVVGIAAFMLIFYGILGFFADIALIVGNIFIIGILSFLGATLTLPGIAGIVLTMGMAVDANVLIYERMREEAHEGRSTISALDNGFRKAFGTIIDSHLTALIAAIALFLLGSGPIRGFAVTLAIGIVSTLFTAYLVTRLIVSVWVQRFRPKTVPL